MTDQDAASSPNSERKDVFYLVAINPGSHQSLRMWETSNNPLRSSFSCELYQLVNRNALFEERIFAQENVMTKPRR